MQGAGCEVVSATFSAPNVQVADAMSGEPQSATQAILKGMRNASDGEIGCDCQFCQIIALNVALELKRFYERRRKGIAAPMGRYFNEKMLGPACLIGTIAIVIVYLVITGVIR